MDKGSDIIPTLRHIPYLRSRFHHERQTFLIRLVSTERFMGRLFTIKLDEIQMKECSLYKTFCLKAFTPCWVGRENTDNKVSP